MELLSARNRRTSSCLPRRRLLCSGNVAVSCSSRISEYYRSWKDHLPLLDCYAFRQISGLVDVAAAADGDVVSEELEGDYFQQGQEKLGGGGDVDGVFNKLGDVLVALDCDGDDSAAAGGYFLNVA